jgi:hypothetical protein
VARADLAGTAHLELVCGVVPVRPEDAVLNGDAARLAIGMADLAYSEQDIADRLADLSLPDAD